MTNQLMDKNLGITADINACMAEKWGRDLMTILLLDERSGMAQ